MNSRVIRGMSTDRNVRFLVVDSGRLVQKACEIHKTLPTASAAFGRVLTGGIILGKLLKCDDETVSLQVKGNGPIGSIFCISDSSGNVKGYIKNPYVDLQPTKDGKLNVGAAVGEGELTVIKDYGLKEQFVGRTALVNGEIGDDLASYFMNSEQQPSIVSLGVFVGETGSVTYSGGMLIQPMPDAGEDTIQKLENIVAKLRPMTSMLRDGLTPEGIISESLKGFTAEVLDENDTDFICDCGRERMEKALIAIGKKDMEQLISEGKSMELKCHFCNKTYDFTIKDLEGMSQRLSD